MKRRREQTRDPRDEQRDEQHREPRDEWSHDPMADLERAAESDRLLMPYSARVVHARGEWPSGAEIRADVLLLGEFHLRGGVGGGMSTKQLIELATARAVAVDRCVDVYVEDDVIPDQREQRRARRMQDFDAESLVRLTRWLLTDRPRDPHLRVHMTDSRPDLVDNIRSITYNSALAPRFSEPTPWELRYAERCFAWLVGFAPPPSGVEADLRLAVFDDDARQTELFLDLQAAYAQKVRKRARGMQRRDLGHLVRCAFETIEWSGIYSWWGVILAAAMDVYVVLRMLAPYTDRPGRPSNRCGQPRHCIFYAGSAHTDHVHHILCRLCGLDPGPTPNGVDRRSVRMRDVVEVGDGIYPPIDRVGELLEAIGLPRLEPGTLQLTYGDSVDTAANRNPDAMRTALQAGAGNDAIDLLRTGLYHGAFSLRDLAGVLRDLITRADTETASRLLYEAVRHGGFVPTNEWLADMGQLNQGRGARDWLPRVAVCRNWPTFVRVTIREAPERASEWTATPLPDRLAWQVAEIVAEADTEEARMKRLVRLVSSRKTDAAARFLHDTVQGGFVPTDEFLAKLGRLNEGRGADDWLPWLTECRNWPAFVRATLEDGPELAAQWTVYRLEPEVEEVVVDTLRRMSRDRTWLWRSRSRYPLQPRHLDEPVETDDEDDLQLGRGLFG